MLNPPFEPTLDRELEAAILAALQSATKPLSLPALRKSLAQPFKKTDVEKLNTTLRALVLNGAVLALGTQKSPAYWDRDPRVLAREQPSGMST